MSSSDDSMPSVSWDVLVAHHGALIRAYNRAYAKLDQKYAGTNKSRFNSEAEKLATDVELVLAALDGEIVEGLELKSLEGEPSVYVVTKYHKFIFSKADDAVEYYLPSMIIRRE